MGYSLMGNDIYPLKPSLIIPKNVGSTIERCPYQLGNTAVERLNTLTMWRSPIKTLMDKILVSLSFNKPSLDKCSNDYPLQIPRDDKVKDVNTTFSTEYLSLITFSNTLYLVILA